MSLRSFCCGNSSSPSPRTTPKPPAWTAQSELGILFRVYLPLSKPALLTIAVFTFLGSWNDLWGPLLYLHDESKYTLPIASLNFVGLAGVARGSPWQLVMAVSTVMMLPVVIVFFLAKQRFIEGIAGSGIKA